MCERHAEQCRRERQLATPAIDLIDEAGSRLRIRTMSAPPRYRELEEEIEKVRGDKEDAIEAQEFEKAAAFRDQEKELKQQLSELKKNWKQDDYDRWSAQLLEDQIAFVVPSSHRGEPNLRFAIVNPTTTIETLSEILDRIAKD